MMKHYLHTWKDFLYEDKSKIGFLPLDMVDFLIEKYFIKPGLLKRGYTDFSNEGFGAEAYAKYIPERHFIIINSEKDLEIYKWIKVILHEIQHANQHVSWIKSLAYREQFTKGTKLPPNIELNNLSFANLQIFWNKVYEYEEDPSEIDAIEFSNKHHKDAVDMVLAREKELNSRKGNIKTK